MGRNISWVFCVNSERLRDREITIITFFQIHSFNDREEVIPYLIKYFILLIAVSSNLHIPKPYQ
jgi:hypothetical protein